MFVVSNSFHQSQARKSMKMTQNYLQCNFSINNMPASEIFMTEDYNAI